MDEDQDPQNTPCTSLNGNRIRILGFLGNEAVKSHNGLEEFFAAQAECHLLFSRTQNASRLESVCRHSRTIGTRTGIGQVRQFFSLTKPASSCFS
jgi:hypothetical protein